MSLVVRKPAFCICENKDADQLCCNREADQRLCFRYTDSTIPLQVSPDKPRCDLTRISVERGCLMDPKIFPKIPNPLIFKSVAL